MKTLVISSQKGGVGKTTVALNLAFSLAQRGWRTLLVDADPQGAIGLSLSKRVSDAKGLADYIIQGAPLAELSIRTKQPGLAILPAGKVPVPDMARYGASLLDGAVFEKISQEAVPEYDIVLVDTPAGVTGASLGALRAATHVLAPMQAEPVALRSASLLLDTISWLRGTGAKVKLAGLLLTMLQVRDRNSLMVAEDLWSKFPGGLVLDATVPRHGAFLQASSAGVPLGLLGRQPPPVAKIFDQVAAELEPRLELTRREADDAPISLVE